MGPSCFGICDARLGPPRAAHEVLPSAVGCRVPAWVRGVVLIELALPVARHLAENPDMRVVAHDRVPAHSGTGSEATAASGSG